MHTEIIPLIKNGFFFDLASHLYNDCCDIPRLIPADEQKLIGLLKHLIESISDLWFDRDEADPDTYQMWTPTKELQDRHKQLRGNISAESAVHQKAMNAEIAQKVSKRLRLSQEFGLLPGEKKVKRVASSQLEAEHERVKRMRGDWLKIMNLVQGARKISDTYFQTYGELCTPFPPETV